MKRLIMLTILRTVVYIYDLVLIMYYSASMLYIHQIFMSKQIVIELQDKGSMLDPNNYDPLLSTIVERVTERFCQQYIFELGCIINMKKKTRDMSAACLQKQYN